MIAITGSLRHPSTPFTRPRRRPPPHQRLSLASVHIDIEKQPRARYRIAVIRMAGPSGLVRVVADDGSLLMTIKRLHRPIDVEDPRFAKQSASRNTRGGGAAALTFFFIDHFERPGGLRPR
jgi:hypothetical protein